MKISNLYRCTYVYLALPLLLFLMTWLRLEFMVVMVVLFLGAFYKAFPCSDDKTIMIDKKTWCTLGIIAFIWCFCGGIGYFYYQSFDYHFRNAVFRDLINYEWPVFYDKANTPLVYYMAFWLPVALIGKLLIVCNIEAETAFYIANIFLFLYALFGVLLIFCHITKAIGGNCFKHIMIGILGFVFFSGLDIIGQTFFVVEKAPFKHHIEWWAQFLQYSSHTTSMFWVFNQFIPTALLTLLFYNERNIKNFGFFKWLKGFTEPILMVAYAVKRLLEVESKKQFIAEEILSVPNLIGVFWILPMVVMYFITNSEGMNGYYYVFRFTTPLGLFTFYMVEFVPYIVLIYKKYKHELLYWVVVVALLAIPFMRLDHQNNFCMRSSIPMMIILSILVIKFVIEEKNGLLKYLLILTLLIGSVTPMYEFYRGFYNVKKERKLNLVTDEIRTLNQKLVVMPIFLWDANHQYTAKNYKIDIFWQWFAKKQKGLN